MKENGKKGENVYPWYRLDKNISWHNINTFLCGLVYGVVTLKIFKKSGKYLRHPGKIWLPIKWG